MNQRLIFINDTINRLEPQVRLLDPSRIISNFVPLEKEISRLNLEVGNQVRRVDYASDNGKKWTKNAKNTLKEMEILEMDVAREIDSVGEIVEEVKSLALNIEQGTGPKVDNALKEARAIIEKIKKPNFTAFRDKVTDQIDHANILLSDMEQYNAPVSNLSLVVANLNDKVSNFTNKIDDLLNVTVEAQSSVSIAENLNSENRIAQETGNFDTVKNSTNEAQDDLQAGEKLNRNATIFLNQAINAIDEISKYIVKKKVLKCAINLPFLPEWLVKVYNTM